MTFFTQSTEPTCAQMKPKARQTTVTVEADTAYMTGREPKASPPRDRDRYEDGRFLQRAAELRRRVREIAMDRLSIQESMYPDVTCFGCGHANPDGLHLRSYRDAELTVAEFTSGPQHDNGFGFLNGGIISTVLDCHTAAVVLWEAAQRNWIADPGTPLPFITSGIEVQFLRPTPLASPVQLSARAVSISEQQIVVSAELAAAGKPRATMTATWLRFHPR